MYKKVPSIKHIIKLRQKNQKLISNIYLSVESVERYKRAIKNYIKSG